MLVCANVTLFMKPLISIFLHAIAVLFSERVEQLLPVKVLITAQCSFATLDIRKSHCETEAGTELFTAAMCCFFSPLSDSLTLPSFTIAILLLLVWPQVKATGVNIAHLSLPWSVG